MSEEKYEKLNTLKDRFLCIVENQLAGDLSKVNAKELGEVVDCAKDMAELKLYCYEAEYYKTVVEAMKNASTNEKDYYLSMYAPETNSAMKGFYGGDKEWKLPLIYGNRNGMQIPYPTVYDPTQMRDMDYNNGRMYYTEMNGNGYMGNKNNSMESNFMRNSSMNNRNMSNMNGMNSNMGNNMNRNSEYMRDSREGRNGLTRKMYMEMKDMNEDKNKKVEEIKKFGHDLADDIMDMIENASPEEKIALKQSIQAIVPKIV